MQQTKTLLDVNENKMYFKQKIIAYYLCLENMQWHKSMGHFKLKHLYSPIHICKQETLTINSWYQFLTKI